MANHSFINESLAVDGISEPKVAVNNIDKDRFNHIIYIVQGVTLLCCNFPIVLAIMGKKDLRKEKGYVIVAALAFADTMSGLFELLAGIRRLRLALLNESMLLVSRRYCMLQPSNLIVTWSTPLQGLMLLAVSTDRLHAVSRPFSYLTLKSMYAFKLCGVVYAYVFVMTMFGWIYSWITQDDTPSVKQICYTSTGLDKSFYQYRTWNSVFGSFASIAVYSLVYPVYQYTRKSFKVTPTSTTPTNTSEVSKPNADQLRRQRRLLITLGYSSVFTFCFVCVGHIVLSVAALFDQRGYGVYGYMLAQMNPVVNVFLYSTRHRDIRYAVLSLVGIKAKNPGGNTSANMTMRNGNKATVRNEVNNCSIRNQNQANA